MSVELESSETEGTLSERAKKVSQLKDLALANGVSRSFNGKMSAANSCGNHIACYERTYEAMTLFDNCGVQEIMIWGCLEFNKL